MSAPPSGPIDDDLNPGSYGFSDPEPPKREAPPIRYDRYAARDPDDPDGPDDPDEFEEEEPRPKKRRRDLAFEPPPELPEPAMPWWTWTVVLTAVGFLGLVATAIVIGANGGAKAGALALVGAVIGVAVETVLVAVLLTAVGLAFGIEYGPVKEAAVKLIGCVAFTNGATLGLGLLCYSCLGPLGVLTALAAFTLIAFTVFQAQFQLNMYEALVTVFAIQGSAWMLAAGLALAFGKFLLK